MSSSLVDRSMSTINVINEYKSKYGEEDIVKYYNEKGTYAEIEKYLQMRMKDKESPPQKTS